MKAITFILLTLSFLTAEHIFSQASYPYPNAVSCCDDRDICQNNADPWGFIKRECTSYVAWKVNRANAQDGGPYPFYNNMTGNGANAVWCPSGSVTVYECDPTSGRLSNACRWDDLLEDEGYFSSPYPVPGAIAHWEAGQQGASSCAGHVAYVDSVLPDGRAVVSEYNGPNSSCSFQSRIIDGPAKYIRFSRFRLLGAISVNPNPIVKGGPVTVTAAIHNDYSSNVYGISIRAAIYDNNNNYLMTIQQKNDQYFTAGYQTKTFSFYSAQIPYSPGTYKIWIETKMNNSPWVLIHRLFQSSTVSVNIVALPDLVANSAYAPYSATANSTISTNCKVRNYGNGASTSSYLGYYLSSDPVLSSNDYILGYDYVSSLASGSFSYESASLHLPSNLVSGTWYLLYKADITNWVEESNESNNYSFRSIQITGSAPTGYCSSSGNSYYGWIQKIYAYGSPVLNKNSGNNNGYGNFTGYNSTTFQAGANAYIAVYPGYRGGAYTNYWRVWIDFNRDGDFFDAGEQVFQAYGNTGIGGYIYIPQTAQNGQTRMRVAAKYGGYPSACGSFPYGETEDYTITITGGANRPGSESSTEPQDTAVTLYKSNDNPTQTAGSIAGFHLKAFPNPVTRGENLQVEVQAEERSDSSALATVHDLLGRQVDKFILNPEGGDFFSHSYRITTNLIPGVYLLRVKIGKDLRAQKFIVQ